MMIQSEANQSEAGGKVIHLQRRGPFTLEQSREMLPLIRKITERWFCKARELANQLEKIANRNEATVLEDALNTVLRNWAAQMRQMGLEVKGPWLVDFDSGDGRYWCWRYPELQITHWHHHTEGFSARKPIASNDPQ